MIIRLVIPQTLFSKDHKAIVATLILSIPGNSVSFDEKCPKKVRYSHCDIHGATAISDGLFTKDMLI